MTPLTEASGSSGFLPPARLKSNETAERTFTKLQIALAPIVLLSILVLFLTVKTSVFLLLVVGPITVLYLIGFLFRFAVDTRSLISGLIDVPEAVLKKTDQHRLPKITILIPLFKEGNKKYDRQTGELIHDGEKTVIGPLIANLKKLDYPFHKKEVFFLLEEECEETIEAVNRQLDIQGFRGKNIKVFVLPPGMETYTDSDGRLKKRRTKWYPQTKPKACNVGLKYATGKYVVIYDAEDQPEPDQALKAVHVLETSPSDVICAQAKLEFRNPKTNTLTKLFAAEYATNYNEIVPGLAKFRFPVPLGGTSNWFRTIKLWEVGGWDPFNVTEDMDLGVRISRRGYRVVVFNSVTWEEATSRYKAWIKQRSRWNKGQMQTYLVHMRNPFELYLDLGLVNFLAFQLIIGLPCFTLLINPAFWSMTVIYLFTQHSFIRELYPTPILLAGVSSMVFGNLMYVYYLSTGCMIRKMYGNVKWALLLAIPYWLLMSFAAYKAFWQLITNPHYWEKTEHGLDTSGVLPYEEMATTASGGN